VKRFILKPPLFFDLDDFLAFLARLAKEKNLSRKDAKISKKVK